MEYKLKIPMTLSLMFDDNELQIEDIEDLDYLQEKYDVDLDFIIEEYEYKKEAGKSYLDEYDDCCGVTNLDLLHSVINDNMVAIVEKFNSSLRLKDIDDNTKGILLKLIINEFNNFVGDDYEVLINGFDNDNLLIDIDSEIVLSDEKIDDIKMTIESYLNVLENKDISDDLSIKNVENTYVYINIK